MKENCSTCNKIIRPLRGISLNHAIFYCIFCGEMTCAACTFAMTYNICCQRKECEFQYKLLYL